MFKFLKMFKIMNGLEVLEWEKELNIKERIRGHNLSYNMGSFKSWMRNNFAFFVAESHNYFVNKVAPCSNVLPPNMINSSSLNGFNAALDNFLKNGHLKI